MRRHALVTLSAAALAIVPLAGCSIISSEHHTSYSGNYVPNDTLSKIRVGESTPDYVEAILGAPTNKADLDQGYSVWRWDYTVRRSGEGSLLLVFDGENSSEKRHSTYVEFRDGVVHKKWRS